MEGSMSIRRLWSHTGTMRLVEYKLQWSEQPSFGEAAGKLASDVRGLSGHSAAAESCLCPTFGNIKDGPFDCKVDWLVCIVTIEFLKLGQGEIFWLHNLKAQSNIMSQPKRMRRMEMATLSWSHC